MINHPQKVCPNILEKKIKEKKKKINGIHIQKWCTLGAEPNNREYKKESRRQRMLPKALYAATVSSDVCEDMSIF